MTDEPPAPPKPAWYASAAHIAKQWFRKSVPTVLGGVSKEESKFLSLKKTGVEDRETTIRDGIRLMSTEGAVQDKAAMQKAAIELLHFPEGVSPTMGRGGPPSSSRVGNPESVFKDLLEAKGPRAEHHQSASALVDGVFTLISLCLYRPHDEDPSKNLTSPFLDLSPLYGSTAEATKKIRIIDGRGSLRPDCFLDERLQLLPPVVSALLALWNRNHNFIAHNLFIRFAVIKGWKTQFEDDSVRVKQDDEIFGITQWINSMQFRNVVAEDVLKGLFGLSPLDPSLGLDVLGDIPIQSQETKMHTYSETRFLYQLSPMISEDDDSTVLARIGEITNGRDIREFSSSAFWKLYNEFLGQSNQDPTTCSYPGLERNARTGRFKDQDLAEIFASARRAPACAPTARNSAVSSRIFHLDSLEDDKACTFNEFRKLYGLKPLPSLSAWNSDPAIEQAADNLYGHIDKVDLYAGLQCEANSPFGFGFGFTKTHAMTIDLVTRIRSHPIPNHMKELASKNDILSTWIKNEVTLDRSRPGNGAALPRILQRNLSEFYPYNGADTYFLFCVPAAVKPEYIAEKGLSTEGSRSRNVCTLSDMTAVQHVFKNSDRYHTLYADSLLKVTNDYGYLLGFDGPSQSDLHDKDRLMTMYALIPDKGSLQRYGALFGKLTTEAIKTHRKPGQGDDKKTTIDVIGGVINEVCTRWVCETLCDYPLDDNGGLKSSKSRTKLGRPEAPQKTAKEMHKEFANLYTFIFKTYDREDGYDAEQRAIKSSKFLRDHLEVKIPKPEWLLPKTGLFQPWTWGVWAKQSLKDCSDLGYKLLIVYFNGIHMKAQSAQTFLERAVQASRIIALPKPILEQRIHDKIARISPGKKPTQEQLDQVERDIEVSRIVANILGLAAVTAVNFPQACSLVVDFYLRKEYDKERAEIVKISKTVTNTEQERLDVNSSLSGYIYEALRIGQPLNLLRYAVEDGEIPTSGSSIKVKKGDVIFANFQTLHNMDPDSRKVDPKRRVMSLLGQGPHRCPAFTTDLEKSFIDATMPEVIKAIFSLDDISRVHNNAHSVLNSVQVHPYPSPMDPKAFISETGELAYYPQTLILEYNDPSSEKPDVKKDVSVWESNMAPNKLRKVTKYTEKLLAIATSFWIVYKIILIILGIWALFLVLLGLGPPIRRAVKRIQDSDVQHVYIECPEPLTIWQDWGPATMEAGPEGKPLDIVYNSTLSIPHRLQFFDADKKDMRLGVFIDDVLRGLTPDFEVNKTEDCGIEPYDCYIKNFSGGDVVVPAGKHDVRIEWAGNEFVNGTTFPDLGDDGSRRIVWARYYCGPQPGAR